jgi:hypothetical protein
LEKSGGGGAAGMGEGDGCGCWASALTAINAVAAATAHPVRIIEKPPPRPIQIS